LVIVATSIPIAPVGAGVEGVLLIVLSPALPFGLLALPMVVLDGVLEISVVVEVGPKIQLVDLIITWAVTCRVVRVAGLGSESWLVLPQPLCLSCNNVEASPSSFELG
jgi:hypothetical protein